MSRAESPPPPRYLVEPGELIVEGDPIYDGGAAYIRQETLDGKVVLQLSEP